MGRKHTFKYWTGQVHLWLGLASGLVIVIVGLTGCILAFQDELKDALYSYRKIEVEDRAFLPPSVLKDKALAAYPKATVSRVVMFNKERPATVLMKNGKDFYYVYINPYSGKLLKAQNMRDDFFMIVQFLHMYLLLPKPVGGQIVDIAVIIFVVMLITGLILWWPRKKAQRKQSFTIKFNGRWRRINYDLHNVLGFYAFAIALIIAITGLSFSYEWVRTSLRKTADIGSSVVYVKDKAPKSDTTKTGLSALNNLLDSSYITAKKLTPEAEMFTAFLPAKKDAALSITAYAQQLHYYKRNDYYFDQYSGKLLKQKPHDSKSRGEKLNDMNYDLHTGQVLGFGGKLAAFLASLVSASLPITGFVIWWGKRKKGKTKRTIVKKVEALQPA